MVNLKAEVEIRSLHQKIDLLLEEELKTLYATQKAQFDVLRELQEKLDRLSCNTTTPPSALTSDDRES